MKTILLLLFILITSLISAQKITDKVGQIEIKRVSHSFLRNDDYELTKKITNKRNRPYNKMYLDSNGLLLKSVNFGKHHDNRLKILDDIRVYKYKDTLLEEVIIYDSGYDKKIRKERERKYYYNSEMMMIKTSYKFVLYNEDEELDWASYEYDKNFNKTKYIKSASTYYNYEYDSINRIVSYKQFYNDTLRWRYNYSYLENQRIGNFQTFYKDGKNNKKREILTFDHGNLIQVEEIGLEEGDMAEKIKIYYNSNNIISKVEYLESFDLKDGYSLYGYTDFKVKAKQKLNKKVVSKINKRIFNRSH
ncbi:hypothetical protein FBALC1_07983 [Flavobacteriales bacterium ALC-1]|nr:hypothetical protein FBALC1_07983 [Flavobacteriales bacterium ALC-1]